MLYDRVQWGDNGYFTECRLAIADLYTADRLTSDQRMPFELSDMCAVSQKIAEMLNGHFMFCYG